jgi:hypothetical protein
MTGSNGFCYGLFPPQAQVIESDQKEGPIIHVVVVRGAGKGLANQDAHNTAGLRVEIGVAVCVGKSGRLVVEGKAVKAAATFSGTGELETAVGFHWGGSMFEQALIKNNRNRLINRLDHIRMAWLSSIKMVTV